jgi:hypothetical protein
MQRDLVVQLWSMTGTARSPPSGSPPPPSSGRVGGLPDHHSHRGLDMMQSTWLRRAWQLASPQRELELPSNPLARTQLNSPLEVVKRVKSPPPEHRRLCEVGHGYGCVHIPPISSSHMLQP